MPFNDIALSPGSTNANQNQTPAQGNPASPSALAHTTAARGYPSRATSPLLSSRIHRPTSDLRASSATLMSNQIESTDTASFHASHTHNTLGTQVANWLTGAEFSIWLNIHYTRQQCSTFCRALIPALINRLSSVSFNNDLDHALGTVFPHHSNDQRNELVRGFTVKTVQLKENIYGEEIHAVIIPHFYEAIPHSMRMSYQNATDDGCFNFTLDTTTPHQPELDIQLKRKDLGQRIRNLAAVAVAPTSANTVITALHEHLESPLFIRTMMQMINQAIPHSKYRNLSDLISHLPSPTVDFNDRENASSISLRFTPKFSRPYEMISINRKIAEPNHSYAFHLNTIATPPYFSILVKEETVYPETKNIEAQRGQEFTLIGAILERNPATTISQVTYRNNGVIEIAQDAGGVSREFFSNAFRDGINLITHRSQEKRDAKELPASLSIDDLSQRIDQLKQFGRLLGYIVDRPMINVPRLFPYDHLNAVVHLSHGYTFPTFNQPISSKSLNAVMEWASSVNHELSTNKTLILQLAQHITPPAYSHYQKALETFAFNDHDMPAAVIEQIEAYMPYLTEKSGIDLSPEKNAYALADNNTTFLQLLLIAQGLAEVKNAREMYYRAHYPSSTDGYLTALCGSGDIRRALCDPHYERHLHIHSEVSFMGRRREKIIKQLIATWAHQASDETLKGFCRAVTGSDVLPDHISNRDNRLAIHIKKIGEAEYAVHACFGTIDLAPQAAWDILKQHRRHPNQIPARLASIMEAIVSDANGFNVA